ncbi:MAG: NADH-quinone oxidoreductase subunit I [Deltaproteobacteria bacterium]|nr:NADH-quinone oxidoreductase subunit I [Deltaproteobacteria bacterium]
MTEATKGTIRIKKVSHDMDVQDRLFVPAIVSGLGATVRHFFKNIFGGEAKYSMTIQYPDVKVEYPQRFRGQHRLVPREDGAPRCVACFMCQTACPARCIHIVAGETEDDRIEKYPAVFEIDELRCVMCGLCVEACPCDAIRMDSGIHPKPVYTHEEGTFAKNNLLAVLGREEAKAGGGRSKAAPPPTAAGTGRKVREHGDGGAGGSAGGYEHPKTKGQPIGPNRYSH